MIEPQVRDLVVYSELPDKHYYSTKLSPKAFHILSAQLYKYKIRAIIRELSCNAADAQKEAGVTRPFQVTLPNTLHPVFSIRDFGTGIKEEDIYNVYTVLFESTKTESNDYTGMLGLGSKTPFAYVETYTVTSFQDGIKKTYIALMGNSRVPSIDLVDTSETDEPDGLQVQFAVQAKDCNEFFNEAKYVYSTFFDIKPEIKGKELSVEELHKNYVYYNNRNLVINPSGGSYVYAVQGNNAYPIQIKDLKSDFFNTYSFSGTVYINLPIGSITFTPNREEMDNTDNNYKAINAFLDNPDLREELETKIRDLTSRVKSQYDACLLWHRIENSCYPVDSSVPKITCGFKSSRFKEIVEELGFSYEGYVSFGSQNPLWYNCLAVLKAKVVGSTYRFSPIEKPMRVYLREDFQGSLKYIKHDLEERPSKAIILNKPYDSIERFKDKDGVVEEVLIKRTHLLEDLLSKYSEFIEVVKSSDLRDKYKNSLKTIKQASYKIFKKDPHSWVYDNHGLTVESEFFYMYWAKGDRCASIFNFYKGLLDAAYAKGTVSLYVVRKSDKAILANFKKAINVEDLLYERVSKIDNLKLQDVVAYLELMEDSSFSSYNKDFKKINEFLPQGFKKPFQDDLEKIATLPHSDNADIVWFTNVYKMAAKLCNEYLLDDFIYPRFNINKHGPLYKEKLDKVAKIHKWYKGLLPILFILDTGDLRRVGSATKLKENIKVLLDYYFVNNKLEGVV